MLSKAVRVYVCSHASTYSHWLPNKKPVDLWPAQFFLGFSLPFAACSNACSNVIFDVNSTKYWNMQCLWAHLLWDHFCLWHRPCRHPWVWSTPDTFQAGHRRIHQTLCRTPCPRPYPWCLALYTSNSDPYNCRHLTNSIGIIDNAYCILQLGPLEIARSLNDTKKVFLKELTFEASKLRVIFLIWNVQIGKQRARIRVR